LMLPPLGLGLGILACSALFVLTEASKYRNLHTVSTTTDVFAARGGAFFVPVLFAVFLRNAWANTDWDPSSSSKWKTYAIACTFDWVYGLVTMGHMIWYWNDSGGSTFYVLVFLQCMVGALLTPYQIFYRLRLLHRSALTKSALEKGVAASAANEPQAGLSPEYQGLSFAGALTYIHTYIHTSSLILTLTLAYITHP